MKLTQIYSNNDELFKKVIFKDGLNIVLAKPTNINDKSKDCHNVGKTCLLELIDYLLLKKHNYSLFNKKENIFNQDIFYLEIYLNSGSSLTIKREVAKKNYVSIMVHKERNQDFSKTPDNLWTYKNLKINKAKNNAVSVLNTLLSFDKVGADETYRKYFPRVVRSQDDYRDIFKLSRYNRSGDIEWKPYLFKLMGFDGVLLKNKYQYDNAIISQNSAIKSLKETIVSSEDETKKIKEENKRLSALLKDLEESLNSVDFYTIDNETEREIVDNVIPNINNLLQEKYVLLSEIKQISKLISTNDVFDTKETEDIFNQFHVYFGEQLKKDINELLLFKKTILEDREQYLGEVLKSKKEKLNNINAELKNSYEVRAKYVKSLNNDDVLLKYNEIKDRIYSIKQEINKNEELIENNKEIDILENKKESFQKGLDTTTESLEESLHDNNELFLAIKDTFKFLVYKVLSKHVDLYIETNKKHNVIFKAEFVEEEQQTSEAEGNTYKKILCLCLDLSILLNSGDNFYEFIYHDGLFDSFEPRKKEVYLDLILYLCNKYNFQYIFSTIDYELGFSFADKYPSNICVELNDSIDGKGTLFKRRF